MTLLPHTIVKFQVEIHLFKLNYGIKCLFFSSLQKLPTAVNRWVQLALLCGAAMLVNAVASPWTLLAMIPAFAIYIILQVVYLKNAR